MDSRSPNHAALVTFDDGYRDNFEQAFPILSARKTPAVFFLPTAFIDDPHAPWWDVVAYICKTSQVEAVELGPPFSFLVDRRGVAMPNLVARIVEVFLELGPHEESALLEQLESELQVDCNAKDLGGRLFFSWEEARAMAKEGMAFGSHSRTHRDLGRLSQVELNAEFVESKAALEANLPGEAYALAYPYGRPENLSPSTISAARDAGYEFAFSATTGPVVPGDADPYRLKRIAIGASDSTQLVRARIDMHAAFRRSFL